MPAAQRPKTYDDLLAPYWKDKMVWKPNDLSGAPGFIGNVLLSMGEERGMDYLRRLAKQNIKMVNASARAILDQVIGGEYAMSLQIFNHHASISTKKGAPTEWLRLSPADRQSRTDRPAHQCAAPERGAALCRISDLEGGPVDLPEANYLPARPDVPPLTPELIPERGGFAATVITPEIQAKHLDRWDKLAMELFR